MQLQVKVCKIIIGVSFTMLVTILLIFSYYMIVDIETKAPKEVESKYKEELINACVENKKQQIDEIVQGNTQDEKDNEMELE